MFLYILKKIDQLYTIEIINKLDTELNNIINISECDFYKLHLKADESFIHEYKLYEILDKEYELYIYERFYSGLKIIKSNNKLYLPNIIEIDQFVGNSFKLSEKI